MNIDGPARKTRGRGDGRRLGAMRAAIDLAAHDFYGTVTIVIEPAGNLISKVKN